MKELLEEFLNKSDDEIYAQFEKNQQLELPFGEVGFIGDWSPTEGPTQAEREQWKSEGRCPQCGELGRFDHTLTMICSQHGPY